MDTFVVVDHILPSHSDGFIWSTITLSDGTATAVPYRSYHAHMVGGPYIGHLDPALVGSLHHCPYCQAPLLITSDGNTRCLALSCPTTAQWRLMHQMTILGIPITDPSWSPKLQYVSLASPALTVWHLDATEFPTVAQQAHSRLSSLSTYDLLRLSGAPLSFSEHYKSIGMIAPTPSQFLHCVRSGLLSNGVVPNDVIRAVLLAFEVNESFLASIVPMAS